MTPISKVYDAFLARISGDEWMQGGNFYEVQQDWRQLLDIAVFRFKHPRISLEIEGDKFAESLGNSEVQLLAVFMKHEWLKRMLMDWQNLKMLYNDRDFSQANFLQKLTAEEEQVRVECERMYGIYDRSEGGKATGFSALAGKGRG